MLQILFSSAPIILQLTALSLHRVRETLHVFMERQRVRLLLLYGANGLSQWRNGLPSSFNPSDLDVY